MTEHDLGGLLKEATADIHAPIDHLVERGTARGRTLRRRRRSRRVVSVAAAVVLIGGGGYAATLGNGNGNGDDTVIELAPATSAHPSPGPEKSTPVDPFAVRGLSAYEKLAEVLSAYGTSTVVTTLPGDESADDHIRYDADGKQIGGYAGLLDQSNNNDYFQLAVAHLDRGAGKAMVQVSIMRPMEPRSGKKERVRGLTWEEGAGVRSRRVTLHTSEGFEISATAYNATYEKDGEVTLDEPVLTRAELVDLVRAGVWLK